MYSSIDKMIAQFGSDALLDLTERSGTNSGMIDPNVVESALSDASSLVDGYLSARYSLPLSHVPELVATLTQNIAFYRLHIGDASEKAERDHKEAMAVLRDISKGVVKLPAELNAPAPVSQSNAEFIGGERVFTEHSLKGFV
jgi:phage gp36-like protein